MVWCLLTIEASTGMDMDWGHMAGLYSSSSWAAILDPVHSQLGRGTGPAGEGVQSAGGEQGRPSAGQGNRAGPGNGLGPAGLSSPPGPESRGHTHSMAVGVALEEFFLVTQLT